MMDKAEIAEALGEAWANLQQAYAEALVALGGDDRLEAYMGRLFDKDDRMLGGLSVDTWITEMQETLTGDMVEDLR